MFDKILIATRGEIACRIIRTARRLGIRTVAVYSDADAKAEHVRLADEAVRIGESPAAASYLDAARLVAAARGAGAEAVHPGYGFLSENAEFAAACAAAGITFIGPGVDAIRIMGSKSAAKALMAKYDVPLVPGYYGEDQTPAVLAAEAERIGYPVLIKASAGGGGRGMRVVRAGNEFAPALASAQREAASAFGDPSVLIEKYIEGPRHIEVQVFGDTHGNLVHLFERDCSLQRRHQKVIEEAPAVHLTDEQRKVLFEGAIAAARAVSYVGAGTVEFVVDAWGRIYFIEMNTRLQVEHPVTEQVTGLDLVEWQLRVASGEPLPLAQDEIECRGHAVEVRVYAEDPNLDFRPSTGRITHLRFPAAAPGVRVDTGVTAGDSVSPFYDAMVAKIITTGPDRAGALQRMQRALEATEIVGVTANIAYLQAIITHPGFAAGGFTTHFLEDQRDALVTGTTPPDPAVLTLATVCLVESLEREARRARRQSADPGSPWHEARGFRLNAAHSIPYHFRVGEQEMQVHAVLEDDGMTLEGLGATKHVTRVDFTDDTRLAVAVDGHTLAGSVVSHGADLHVFCNGAYHKLTRFDPLHAGEDDEAVGGSLTAPMPGAVRAVLVAVGDIVERGQPLLVLEAMKIEHTISAPCGGTVTEIRFATGDQVMAEGVELVKLEPLAEAAPAN
ncbi:MAG: acetyl-CoA carboxylase biotin carboxylase subunit [Gammaproteobacteria bacterium]|nr:acetyl-CoA carboxylase biotin carboxylase subunit [Gammaproteobacteria bacterium]